MFLGTVQLDIQSSTYEQAIAVAAIDGISYR
jgi:hypothetical protein